VNEDTRVPAEYVKNGEIVLNLSYDATHKLTITNELVQFSARFSGVSRECSVPMAAVAGIFARENGQGLFFPPEASGVVAGAGSAAARVPATAGEPEPPPPTAPTRPKLQIVK
jgi:stringent starvation protein B